MNLAQETLGFRRTGFSPVLSLLMSAFALEVPPAVLAVDLQQPSMLPYRSLSRARSFGTMLEPRYIFRAGSLDQ